MGVNQTSARADAGTAGQPETGGRILVRCLAAEGVELVYGVPGESYLEILDALYDQPAIKFVCCRHEGAAANMAEADGKMTGRPGICMVTRGPGATHAAIGVHTAMQDSTPMVLLVGQVPLRSRGREAWQEIDYEKMFGPVAKWVAEIDAPERIPELIARAFAVATSGRPGPVVLSLPEDVLSAKCILPPVSARAGRSVAIAGAPNPSELEQFEKELCQARNPVVFVGGSHWTEENCESFRAFVEAWDLPVISSFRRQDAFDNSHPNYVGHGGLGLNPKLAARIKSADLILAVGCRISDTMTNGYTLLAQPRPEQRLIHIYPDPDELNRVYQADLAICSSLGNFVDAIRSSKPASAVPWRKEREDARQDFLNFTAGPAKFNNNAVDLADTVLHLTKMLPADAMITNGAGNYTVWVHRYYRYRKAKTQLAPVSGAMGYGLPAAIAAKLRHPDRTVVCFAGDGCFLMYPQELSTAVQAGAAIIVLIANNGLYGTIRMHQERHHPGRPIGTDIPSVDYVNLAQSLGAHAERVESNSQFPEAFARALAAGRPAVLELMTDRLQLTPDMRLSHI